MVKRLQGILKTKKSMLFGITILVLLVMTAACQTAPGPADGTLEIPSGREPDASVSGTVTYRERIALTPGGAAGGGVAGRVIAGRGGAVDRAADY